MTLAERFNAETGRILPRIADSLAVDPTITSAGEIDDIVFRRSEYRGGIEITILAKIHPQN